MIVGTRYRFKFLKFNESIFYRRNNQSNRRFSSRTNTSYSPFIVEDIDFESFPPLKSNFGDVTFQFLMKRLLYKRIGSNSTTKPLLATFEINGRREAVLFGEGIWQWRAQSFLNTKSFSGFDNFIGKTHSIFIF